MLACLLRRTYDPAELLVSHPPKLKHAHKRMVFELACPVAARHIGPITVTRWAAASLPAAVPPAQLAARVEAGTYAYEDSAEIWHVNFADPHLFVAYGSALLAQDELQAAEHPLAGCVREALLAERDSARTEDNLLPTPMLVGGLERRCAIDTAPRPSAGRPLGLYGNRFAAAPLDVARAAVTILAPPTRSNLIAIAAPGGGRGAYFRADIEKILVTAYTGFAAAVHEGAREVRTGFWGCGAFGGNRELMALLQLLAAELAGIDRLRFYAFDEAGLASYTAGAAALARVRGAPGTPLGDLLERIADLDHVWGASDGN